MIDHYDGESGKPLLSMTRAAASDCSTPGQAADQSVAFWLNKVTWIADDATLRACLDRYGAWDDLDTADIDTIKSRVLWIAACDWREESDREIDEEATREEERIEEGQARWSETGRTRKG
jgi:hypothetical protein